MIKKIFLIGSVFSLLFPLIIFITIFISDEEDISSRKSQNLINSNLSEEVLKHKPMIEKYCSEYGISDYVHYILAIVQVESGGTAEDVMQSSESLGLPVNSLSTEESIKQGCKYFSELLTTSEQKGCDIESVIQSYNYGGGFLGYVEKNGKQYKFELAENFACEMANGIKVDYPNPIAIEINGGYRYNYGNMFYVKLVQQYLVPDVQGQAGELFEALMNEALKYEGDLYVFGGKHPTIGFDCSGLTYWCYSRVGYDIPKGANGQLYYFNRISKDQVQPGDLVFFCNTYEQAGPNVATHVAIYIDENTMYHAGGTYAGVGRVEYTNLKYEYWQTRLIGYGRVPPKE